VTSIRNLMTQVKNKKQPGGVLQINCSNKLPGAK